MTRKKKNQGGGEGGPPQQAAQPGGSGQNKPKNQPQQGAGDGKPRQQQAQGGQTLPQQQQQNVQPQTAWGQTQQVEAARPAQTPAAPHQQGGQGGQKKQQNRPKNQQKQPQAQQQQGNSKPQQQQQAPPGFAQQPQNPPGFAQQSSWGPPLQQSQPAPTQQLSFFADSKPKQHQPPQNQQTKRPPQQQQQQQQRGSTQSLASSESSKSSIDKGMSSMSLAVKPTPNNMRVGTRGKPCKLEANYLPIKFNNLPKTVYHYDVSFDPDVAKKFFSSAVDKFMEAKFKGVPYAHDGRKNLYTAKELPLNGQSTSATVTAVIGDRSKEYKVIVKFARNIDMSGLTNIVIPTGQQLGFDQKPLLAITALNIIIRKCFKNVIREKGAVPVASSLYMIPQQQMALGEGLELWYGLFQSVVMGQKSMYLNVDVSHKAFPSQVNLIELLRGMNRGQVPRGGDPYAFRNLEDHLKSLDVTYDRKTYRFMGLMREPANEFFEMEKNGKKVKMSVLQYLEKEKGIRLQYPDLPCLKLGRAVVPLELCSIPGGQATNKKTSGRVTAAIIKYSATTADVRKSKIHDLLKNVNYSNDLRDFGIEINKKFETINGRVIDAPKIKYAGRTESVRQGVWNGGDFLETPAESQINWAIINCDNYASKEMPRLKNVILKAANMKKINLCQKELGIIPMNLNDRNFYNLLKDTFASLKKGGCNIVFVIIQDRNDNYAKVKQAAELNVGIMTQCIKSRTLERIEGMTIGNILLKVNAKLRGKNHEIIESAYNTKTVGTMFVGADVTHAGPDQRDIPSVVGVVSSYDKVGFKYQCSWRLQKKTRRDNQIEEIIQDLESVMVDHLDRYMKTNGSLPTKIMYYRDGVSEGQFKEVMDVEMSAIRKAMTRKYGPDMNKHAKVTFVVVQKRHHARFFPTQKEFTDGKNRNIPAGTVVDTDIVDPYTFQFFLASHAAIQGVTKPTKYCILLDESGFNADDLQAITYDLCHLFTRCNRSVSYPAPTYYAHLVAARGKQYIIGARLNLNILQKEYENRKIETNFNASFPMFFV